MKMKDDNGNLKYHITGKLALNVLSLPTSNADAGRLFSKLNLTKTKCRNSLQMPTINALITMEEYAKCKGGGININVTDVHQMMNVITK